MKTRLATAILTSTLSSVPHLSQAADLSRAAIDACAKAFVASLGAHYGSDTKLRATEYPMRTADAYNALVDADPTEMILTARNPRARGRFVASVACTVGDNGQPVQLHSEHFEPL